MIEKVNLSQKFELIHDHWHPRIAGQINDFHLKLVKLKGEFVWHHHETEDELFLVVKGRLRINIEGQPPVELEAGEFVSIPHGVEHQPVAAEECHLILLEPAGTLNTGSAQSHLTVSDPELI